MTNIVNSIGPALTVTSSSYIPEPENSVRKFIPAIKIIYTGAGSPTIQTNNSGSLILNGQSFSFTGKKLDAFIAEVNGSSLNQGFELYKAIDIGSEFLNNASLIQSSASDKIGSCYIIRYNGLAFRYNENAFIKLLPPTALGHLESWYPRFTNGSFTTKFSNYNFTAYPGISPDATYLFSIPEYKNQDWSLKYGPPYKDVYGELPRSVRYNQFVGTTVIKVANTPLLWDNNISIKIKDTFQNASIIKHVDIYNGLIYLNIKLDASIPIRVDYTYLENNYVYDAIDLNVTLAHNPLVIDTFVAFYLKPSASNGSLISGGNSIFHEVLNTNLAGKMKIANIIPSTKNTDNPLYEPVIYLGSINIRHSQTAEDIEVIDTRTRGGGLYPADKDSIRSSWRHAEFFWDTNPLDGIPIPGNSSIIINLPDSVKSGNLTRSEIKNIGSKDVALGVVPIFDGLES